MRILIITLFLLIAAFFITQPAAYAATCEAESLVQEGDLVFIAIGRMPFTEVAETQKNWASHVALVMREKGAWVGYEASIPVSRTSSLCSLVGRAHQGKFAITRFKGGLNSEQVEKLRTKAKSMLGIIYHTGFDFDDWRQFCSKFTYLAYEAAGLKAGTFTTFQALFDLHEAGPAKEALLTFWKRWFWAGFRWSGIPWNRRTVLPASQLYDDGFELVTGSRD